MEVLIPNSPIKNVTLSAQFSYGAGNKILDYFGRFVKSDGTLTATYPGYRSQVGNYWTPEIEMQIFLNLC